MTHIYRLWGLSRKKEVWPWKRLTIPMEARTSADYEWFWKNLLPAERFCCFPQDIITAVSLSKYSQRLKSSFSNTKANSNLRPKDTNSRNHHWRVNIYSGRLERVGEKRKFKDRKRTAKRMTEKKWFITGKLIVIILPNKRLPPTVEQIHTIKVSWEWSFWQAANESL